jgi:DNA segregation ATPase FtsK/SpoIIIE, S-DNA-T family
MSRRTHKAQTSDKPSSQTSESESTLSVLDRFGGWWLRVRKYGWDVFGVILLAFTIISLLGLVGLTSGQLIDAWIGLLDRLFGWGAAIMVGLVGLAGISALRQHYEKLPDLKITRVLALEGMAFSLIAFFAAINGGDLDRAQNGLDGGIVGYGLITPLLRILPGWLGSVISGLIAIFFGYFGLGLDDHLTRIMEKWLGSAIPAEPMESLSETKPTKNKRRGTPLAIETEKPVFQRDERLPPLNLLMNGHASVLDETQILETADLIVQTLAEFGIPVRVAGFRTGPVVTQFAVEPGFVERIGPDGKPVMQKVRVSQISNLAKDLARALSAERLRIEAPVPGRSYVGIEVPNSRSSTVRLRPILETERFNKLGSPLALALGEDVAGQPVVADLVRMPHLLIAGTTGSGKSVCIAAITTCLAVNNTPEDLKLAMLDPKMVELVRFNGLPHLLGKVETDIERMLAVLRWALAEMDRRYRLLETAHARDLDTYNRKMDRLKGERLPRIVILIDELADMMMTAPDQTEHAIVRLAQMARATGIHLIVATQRPSADVITGLIKANFPTRISFTVASSVDSRVILDVNGAETLLGRGDMLFLNPEEGVPVRAQGVFVTDQEVSRVIHFWQKMLNQSTTPVTVPPWEDLVEGDEDDEDELIERAIEVVRKAQRASTSLLQRRLRIGYPRAARLIDQLEEMGVVGPSQGGGREREVLLSDEDEDDSENQESDVYEADS